MTDSGVDSPQRSATGRSLPTNARLCLNIIGRLPTPRIARLYGSKLTRMQDSVLPKGPGRRPVFDGDASAAHAQIDPPRGRLTRVNEVGANRESLVASAHKVRGNAAHPGLRVDRVRTRIRQHHGHVAGVAIHLDVAAHVAHPHVAKVVMNDHTRGAGHM